MNDTLAQYDSVVASCKLLFTRKAADYGTAWRVLRPESVTDQIFIKAQRIKTIDSAGVSRVEEGIGPEFQGIVNYGIIGLIQLERGEKDNELSAPEVEALYDGKMASIRKLMTAKNHDYGEAWRGMRVSSFTDLILMKIMRIRKIEDNKGKTVASEGVDANLRDIVNYAIFALIQIGQGK